MMILDRITASVIGSFCRLVVNLEKKNENKKIKKPKNQGALGITLVVFDRLGFLGQKVTHKPIGWKIGD